MSKLYAFVKYFCVYIIRLFFPFKVIGKENIPKDGGYCICANHTHIMDVFFLAFAFDKPIKFMAKQELFSNKLFAKILENLGAFPVYRDSAKSLSAVKAAIKIVRGGGVLGIFPEGTRNPEGPPKRAKSGIALIASSTKSGVVPVSLYHKGKLRVFKKTVIRIGEPITQEELKINSRDRSELKRVSETIMQRITNQWEEDACK